MNASATAAATNSNVTTYLPVIDMTSLLSNPTVSPLDKTIWGIGLGFTILCAILDTMVAAYALGLMIHHLRWQRAVYGYAGIGMLDRAGGEKYHEDEGGDGDGFRDLKDNPLSEGGGDVEKGYAFRGDALLDDVLDDDDDNEKVSLPVEFDKDKKERVLGILARWLDKPMEERVREQLRFWDAGDVCII
ncbi:MAG: hypothetical protein Q9220_001124 [cf. Caloplaca sp. 1 TL-2023]